MTTDPTTTLDKLLHALGAIQADHGCLLGSTVANAGIMADHLGDAAKTVKAVIKGARDGSGLSASRIAMECDITVGEALDAMRKDRDHFRQAFEEASRAHLLTLARVTELEALVKGKEEP